MGSGSVTCRNAESDEYSVTSHAANIRVTKCQTEWRGARRDGTGKSAWLIVSPRPGVRPTELPGVGAYPICDSAKSLLPYSLPIPRSMFRGKWLMTASFPPVAPIAFPPLICLSTVRIAGFCRCDTLGSLSPQLGQMHAWPGSSMPFHFRADALKSFFPYACQITL